MRKGKTKIKKMTNKVARHVTFSKRRKGLFKKAYELSKLCDAKIAVVVFSNANNLFEYSSSLVSDVIAMRNDVKTEEPETVDQSSKDVERAKHRMMSKELDDKENELRHMRGHGLHDLAIDELKNLEDSIAASLKRVHAEKIERLKKENKELQEDALPTLSNLLPPDSGTPNGIGYSTGFLRLGLPSSD